MTTHSNHNITVENTVGFEHSNFLRVDSVCIHVLNVRIPLSVKKHPKENAILREVNLHSKARINVTNCLIRDVCDCHTVTT